MKSYEGYTKAVFFGVGAGFIILAIMMFLDAGLGPIVGFAAALLAVLFIVNGRANARFPQWKKLRWRTSSAMLLVVIVICMALLAAEHMFFRDTPLLILGAFLAGMLAPWKNYRKARQYHMDELASIEELKQKYPDAEKDIVVK